MTALLDVNALVALAWPNHVHHASALEWFGEHASAGWATCPVTESGFVRVSSNRRALPTATTVAAADDLLAALRKLEGHRFWTDDISVATCQEVDVHGLAGYRLVTDAHLVALATRRGGRLVTFDRAVRALAAAPDTVVLLSTV